MCRMNRFVEVYLVVAFKWILCTVFLLSLYRAW